MAAFSAASADCSAAATCPVLADPVLADPVLADLVLADPVLADRAGRPRAGRTRVPRHPAAPWVLSSRAWLASEAAMLASSWARAGGARASRRTRALAASVSAASSAASVAARGARRARRGGGRRPRGGAGSGRDDQHRRQPGQVLAVLGEQRPERARQSRRPGQGRVVPGDQRLLGGDRVVQHGHVRRGCGQGAEPAHALAARCHQRHGHRGRGEHAAPSQVCPHRSSSSLSPGASAERRGSRGVAGGRHPGWTSRASRMIPGRAAGHSAGGQFSTAGRARARTGRVPAQDG